METGRRIGKGMAAKRLIVALAVVSLTVCGWLLISDNPVAAGDANAIPGKAPGENRIWVSFENGLLSLTAREAEIGAVLRAVAEKAGIGLTVGEGVAGTISLAFEGIPVEEALRRLCENRAIVYEYDDKTKTCRVIRAAAFASTPGKGALKTAAAPAEEIVPAASGSSGRSSGGTAKEKAEAGGADRLQDSRGRPLYKARELLVRFRPEATELQIEALHRSLGSSVLKALGYLKLHRVRLREGLSETEGAALYAAAKIVAAVERHALRYPLLTPNDPYYSQQWNMTKINMPGTWEIAQGRGGIVIGVIDSGVDTRHPDLAANIWNNPAEIPDNGIDDDHNGYIDDVRGWDFTGTAQPNGDNDPIDSYSPAYPDSAGHGTHVAGIIAAAGNNGLGVAGIGWGLRIMPLKVLADNSPEMLLIDIVEAIDYAIANGVRIVNCSFGGEYLSDQVEYDAFERLREKGILAVCAAGNSGKNNDAGEPRIYPASYDLDNIISVASSDLSDNLFVHSNYGKTSVDLMAPGETILSTCLCPARGNCNSYCKRSGTSIAAPHVAGVAGLILSRNPGLGYARVKSLLLESTDPIPSVLDKLLSGGRLNAFAALSRVCLRGDVSQDGLVGLDDVILSLRIAAGQDAGAEICLTADVDGDGRIGLAEALYGLRRLAGLPD